MKTVIVLMLLALFCLAADPADQCRCPDVTVNGIDEGLTQALEVTSDQVKKLCVKGKAIGPCLGAVVVYQDIKQHRSEYREASE